MAAPNPRAPLPHASGARPPDFAASEIPAHVAVVMDGNGRWAHQRGLPRTAGHEAGEFALFDVVHGALELGVKWLSVYAFSTENWKRSPEEVRFLMGFNRDVVRRRREEINDLDIRVRWAGRPKRLWRSVISEIEYAEALTQNNTTMNLVMCINYGGRAEIADAVRTIAESVRDGRMSPRKIDEDTVARHLYVPDMPDVDLFVRSSGEQRTSNFLPWQAAYAELVFLDVLWPDFDRTHLWQAIEIYSGRERRYGAAPPLQPPMNTFNGQDAP
jgi:undecaprenyl diphosphate synthase